MAIRIAVVGAGSRSFGPAIIRDVLLSEPLCGSGVELVLMDVVAEHLRENAAYAERIMRKLNRGIAVTATTSLDEALGGAAFVVTAFEKDRYRYWAQDFHIPRKYGFKQVYGENGGPGGAFHALRNMGPILHVARTMERLCPSAVLLNFSNPEHKLCEAVARLTSVQSVGLCHGVFMGHGQIAEILDLPPTEVETAACGINHFTWFQSVKHRRTGEDLYPQVAERERRAPWVVKWHELALGRMLFRTFGLWPSPATNHYGEYLRWAAEFMASELHFYYEPTEGEPWVTGNLPEFVYTIDGVATHRPWRVPAAIETPSASADDGPVKASGELAVPIIEGLMLDIQHELAAVNVPNRGAIPNLPDDAVVEVPAVVDRRGIVPVKMSPLPEAIAALIRPQLSINKLLVEAFARRSKRVLLQALLLDPTIDSYRNAVAMMTEMTALQKDLLPEWVE